MSNITYTMTATDYTCLADFHRNRAEVATVEGTSNLKHEQQMTAHFEQLAKSAAPLVWQTIDDGQGDPRFPPFYRCGDWFIFQNGSQFEVWQGEDEDTPRATLDSLEDAKAYCEAN